MLKKVLSLHRFYHLTQELHSYHCESSYNAIDIEYVPKYLDLIYNHLGKDNFDSCIEDYYPWIRKQAIDEHTYVKNRFDKYDLLNK